MNKCPRKKHCTNREMGWLFIQWLYFTTNTHKVPAVVVSKVVVAAVAAATHKQNQIDEKRKNSMTINTKTHASSKHSLKNNRQCNSFIIESV